MGLSSPPMSRLLHRVAARQRSSLSNTATKTRVLVPQGTATRSIVSTPTLDEFLSHNLGSDDSSAPSTSAWPAEQMRQRMVAMKTRMLLDLMSRPNPQMNAVWHSYEDLVAYAGDDPLPLEIHQLALRNSVLSPQEARRVSKAKYLTVHFPDEPLPLEERIMTILRNMRDGGMQPKLEDYHFVLRQYASVGHFTAAEKMLQEIEECELKPTPVTYGYVLQACAHRSKLPSHAKHVATQQLVECVRRLIAVMAEREIPMAPANVDLAARVLRFGADEEGFAQLVKYAYDFDLSFTDHAPLDVTADAAAVPASMPRTRLSTAALNMIIDELGRRGRISKMIEAFEVLTNPLPQPSSAELQAYDEDEDGGYTPITSSAPASAPPNTTTFRLLVGHAAKANHPVLARHYILHALHLEVQESRRIRAALRVRPPTVLPVQPQVAVQMRLLYPLMHLAVRQHDSGMLRFVRNAALRSIKSKWGDIDTLTQWRAAVEEQEAADTLAPPPPEHVSNAAEKFPFEQNESLASGDDAFAPTLPTPPRLSTFFTPSSSTPSLRPKPAHIAAYEPVDRKPLNYALHMLLLQTERAALDELVVTTSKLYARSQQRMKERLGRRVWRDQDVYVRSAGDRVRVDKNFWRSSVKFWGVEDEQAKAEHGQRRFGREGVWEQREV